MSHLITGLLVPVTFCSSTKNLGAMLVVQWLSKSCCKVPGLGAAVQGRML